MAYRSIRGLARNLLIRSASAVYRQMDWIEPALARNRVQILLFHDVPAGSEVRLLRLVQKLARTHQFISYSEAVERIISGQIDAPMLSITFDDGLYNSLRAAQVLSSAGIRACFFVCPAGLDAASTRDEYARYEFCRRLQIPPAGLLSWSGAESLLSLGHEIGGHSVNHWNLRLLSPSEAEVEIHRCAWALQKNLGTASHFAWPFGGFQHFTPVAARAVFANHFISCASGLRGCHIANGPMHPSEVCIRRDNLEIHWSIPHIEFFLARNALARDCRGSWPKNWIRQIHVTPDRGMTGTSA